MNELFEVTKISISYSIIQQHLRDELTDEEFVNPVFESQKQVSEAQANNLVLLSYWPAVVRHKFMWGLVEVACNRICRGVRRKLNDEIIKDMRTK